jgi:5,10-methylene-tetrahydrofolate dehydrogenase/methenyl tetrahydrofolate cyclohydrolase
LVFELLCLHPICCERPSAYSQDDDEIIRASAAFGRHLSGYEFETQVPGLAVVLVGTRTDSETYVRNKEKACEEVGFQSFRTDLPETATQEEVLKVVAGYNANGDVHGILVQLPLPKHMDAQIILDAIGIEKDVDGFHPQNIGSLALRGRAPKYVSCTPKGCMELLKRSGVDPAVCFFSKAEVTSQHSCPICSWR